MENFGPANAYPPTSLPPGYVDAQLSARPLRDPGGEPRAAVLLVEIDVQGLAA